MNGHSVPTFRVALRVAEALGRELDSQLDIRELFSETGQFPTTFVCDLLKCPGCLPARAVDDEGVTNPMYEGLKKGYWTGDIYELEEPFWQPVEELS